MKFERFSGVLIAVITIGAVIVACHRTIETASRITGTPIVSRGVMKKGSVIVNGVTFDASHAQITGGEILIGEDELQDGFVVNVRGSLHPDGVTGLAEKVKTEVEIAGTIIAKGNSSITLVGQQVFVDSRTTYGGVSNLLELVVGHPVSAHGIWDSQNRLLATHVELLPGHPPPTWTLKGVVEGPFTGGNPPFLSFTLRGLRVTTAEGSALIRPDGATINLGDSVRVEGLFSGATFTALSIDLKDLEDAEFEPQEGKQFDVEGFVSDFTSLDADFTVDRVATRLTGTARFESGTAADLIDNVRVEADGHVSGGVLLAEKIRFDDTVRIEANADAASSANVLGKTVVVSGRADLVNLPGGVGGIVQGQGLKIRGFENRDGSVTATRIEGLNNSVDVNGVVIQGVTEAFRTIARTITIMGITIDASGAAAFGKDGAPISLDQFFALLAADRTIVKGKGAFSATTSTLKADKVEIE